MPKNIFSMRAECAADVDYFFAEAKKRGLELELRVQRTEQPLPDTVVEFLGAADVGQVKNVLSNMVDSLVMRQTLRMCPLLQNSFERNSD